jgi:anti-sigma B factor antagonist
VRARGLGERALCVALAGELDMASVPWIDGVLRTAQSEADLVVLDLRPLQFMDCSGAHLVLEADRRAQLAGCRLLVVRGPDQICRLFRLTGLDRRLTVIDEPPAGELEQTVNGA